MKPPFFSKNLVQWYESNRRDLPWRRTADPYKIWLSEIMLQQTRVAQAEPYYKEVVKRFPTVFKLAEAKEQEVLRLWQGLGYYSRARNMLHCAKTIVHDLDGKFPSDFSALKKLKGIGAYTAAAIASIAFHQKVAVVDGNVYRVLARVFGLADDIATPSGQKAFHDLANSLIPAADPGTYNQAVMEFGALQCVPVGPDCSICPFRKSCIAHTQGMVEVLPVKSKKVRIRNRYFYYVVLTSRDKIVIRRRQEKDIWMGMNDFPLFEPPKRLERHKMLRTLSDHFGVKEILAGTAKISREYRHQLTHQLLHVKFIHVGLSRIPEKLIQQSKSLKVVGLSGLAKVPKPVLIARFLEDEGIL